MYICQWDHAYGSQRAEFRSCSLLLLFGFHPLNSGYAACVARAFHLLTIWLALYQVQIQPAILATQEADARRLQV